MGVRLGELFVAPKGTTKSYKISQMKSHLSPFFGISLHSLGEDSSKTLALEPRFHAPIVVRIAQAIAWLNFSTSDACSASTITRARGSVREYRNTMRPLSPRVDSASRNAISTSGRPSSGGFDFTFTFTIVCG